MEINKNTKVIYEFERTPVLKAVEALKRDILNTCLDTGKTALDIVLDMADCPENDEEYFNVRAQKKEGKDILRIEASGDIGFIYGIYHISRKFLGVQPFWFWNEQTFFRRESYKVPDDYFYESGKRAVALRGWFINDEVLFDEWNPEGKESFPWEMAFEALLRCGGNMTIPGTDHNSHKYKNLARDYGLWITHHHAEPLGAEMFARAYPDLDASFDKYPDLFRDLWKKAIENQKDCKVVWNLGFRGQGDRPFWADDPSYDTQEARGKLMSDLIMEQYNLVKEADPKAICCTNLYGETMELYRDGFLKLPEDVIKIWADNGFGKMVSRRQNNHNPRVYALPLDGDNGAHGIYYHASFYDLQAAAQMTMLPNSTDFVVKELSAVLSKNVDDFWMINCSNVKMHTYYLDIIARMWNGINEKSDPVEMVNSHNSSFCNEYYEESVAEVAEKLYKLWPMYAVSYGPHEDDHAGEQLSNHGSRMLVSAFISNFDRFDPINTKADTSLDWICPSDKLLSQVKFYMAKFEEGTDNYREYLDKCRDEINSVLANSGDDMVKASVRALDNNLIMQIEYLYYSNLGALHACKSILYCLDSNETKSLFDTPDETREAGSADFLSAFYEAGLSAKAFHDGYDKMRGHETGIWRGFYKNDCEADIRQSAILMEGLMSYLRVLGDGPHFYRWQRKFQSGAGGDRIHLILRLKEHLTDMELWNLMSH